LAQAGQEKMTIQTTQTKVAVIARSLLSQLRVVGRAEDVAPAIGRLSLVVMVALAAEAVVVVKEIETPAQAYLAKEILAALGTIVEVIELPAVAVVLAHRAVLVLVAVAVLEATLFTIIIERDLINTMPVAVAVVHL
jgi:hypothetical protein